MIFQNYNQNDNYSGNNLLDEQADLLIWTKSTGIIKTSWKKERKKETTWNCNHNQKGGKNNWLKKQ